jgi:hypothetical protein
MVFGREMTSLIYMFQKGHFSCSVGERSLKQRTTWKVATKVQEMMSDNNAKASSLIKHLLCARDWASFIWGDLHKKP